MDGKDTTSETTATQDSSQQSLEQAAQQADAQTGNTDTQQPASEPKQTPQSQTDPTTATPSRLDASVSADAAVDDPVTQMRQRMAGETRRVEAIRKLCGGKHADIEAKAIEEGWDETKTELHLLRASRPKVAPATTAQRPAGPQVFEAIALMASGMPSSRIEAVYAEPILEAADKLRGVGIQEFCELAASKQLPRFRRDRRPSAPPACPAS